MKELHKAKMTANMAMLTDGNGHPSASDKITKTELNMLNNVRSNIQTQIDNLEKTFQGLTLIPDWSNAVELDPTTQLPYTAPSNGYFYIITEGDRRYFKGSINGILVKTGGDFTGQHEFDSSMYPVAAGDILSTDECHCILYFIPSK